MSTTALAASSSAGKLRALAADLIARDAWSVERLHVHRQERLRALLRHAVDASPYYRKTLGADAGAGDVALEELPTLSKTTLLEEFDRILVDRRLRRADLEAHLASAAATDPFCGYRVLSTSGTSGERAILVYAGDEFAIWLGAVLRATARMGVTPQTRLVGVGAPSSLHLSKQQFATLQEGREDVPQLSVLTPPADIVKVLNDYRPEALTTYPTMASLLAEEQLAGRLDLDLSIVGVGGEVLGEDDERRIRDAWGVRPFNVYAATEAPMIASASRAGTGLHVCDDLLVIEVVDERNRPVEPGTPGHKLLVTNLVNRVQPLVRYEISDSVTLAEDDPGDALPYRRIARIDGRSDDVLRLPARGGGETVVHPAHLRAPFAGFPDVTQYQVVHRKQRLHVRVVLRQSAPGETLDGLRAALVRQLETTGAVAPPVVVEQVPALEREPGPAAKLKFVKAAQ